MRNGARAGLITQTGQKEDEFQDYLRGFESTVFHIYARDASVDSCLIHLYVDWGGNVYFLPYFC